MPKVRQMRHRDKLRPSPYLEKHRNLLRDFKFKFEGLNPELTEHFRQIVKDLGATVCEDAEYILTDSAYTLRDNNDSRQDLYSLAYIFDAISSEELPDIETYRFHDDTTYQIGSDKENHVSREKTDKNSVETNDETFFENPIISNESDNASPLRNGYCSKSFNSENEVTDEEKHVSSYQGIENGESSKTGTNKNSTVDKEKNNVPKDYNKNATESSSTLKSKTSDSLNISNDKSETKKTPTKIKSEPTTPRKTRSSEKKVNSNETNTSVSPSILICKVQKVTRNSSLSDQEESKNKQKEANETRLRTRSSNGVACSSKKASNSKKASEWIDTRSTFGEVIAEKKENEGSDDLIVDAEGGENVEEVVEEIDVEDMKHLYRKEWWKDHPIPERYACQIPDCVFEPGPHEKHDLPSRHMSMNEKKILLKYLIMHKQIKKGKGTRIYEKMHQDGYLRNRSVETLRNCFKRTIFNNTELFNLPQNILDEIIDVNLKKLK